MKLSTGLVGLPNAGKSTLFNLLTASEGAEVANYAFCTIDPNVGFARVYDQRLGQLTALVAPQQTTANRIQIVDIAGLVKGASAGEGLGTAFLSHIRSVTALVQVVRVFQEGDVTHVDGSVDPSRDLATVDLELRLEDIAVLQRAIDKRAPLLKQNNAEAKLECEMFEYLQGLLDQDLDVRNGEDDVVTHPVVSSLNLLTAKPSVIVANIDEPGNTPLPAELIDSAKDRGIIEVSVALEVEANELEDPSEQRELLESFGIHEQGLRTLTRTLYEQLELRSFFTAGEKEVRAWSLGRHRTALDAAAAIHTDLRDGFIRADVVSYDQFTEAGSWQQATSNGYVRSEGRAYEVQDGDLILVRFR